jgi:hypothetical protein
MKRLRGVESAEVAGVVGYKDQVASAGVTHDIPVLPAGAADPRDVLRLMAGIAGDGQEIDAQALVDQKPRDKAMLSRLRRLRRTGRRSCHGCLRGRPRKG